MNEELIRLGEARERLGVSRAKMAALVKSGRFPTYGDPLDGRVTLVRWSEVQSGLQPTRRDDAPALESPAQASSDG